MHNLTITFFTSLNSGKLRFVFKVIFIAFAILLTAFYFLPLAGKPILPILVAFHLGFSFLIASIGVAIIYLGGYFYFSRQETMFASGNLKAFLSKYDFETGTINGKNKWQLTQRIKRGKIYGYPVVIFKRHHKWNAIIAVFELDLKHKTQPDLLKLRNALSKKKFTIDENAILAMLHVTENMEEQMMQFIKVLQGNNIQPAT